MAVEPQRVVATGEHAGRSCPYCRFPLKEGGDLVLCGHCHAAHHADCWDENHGCAVMACAGGPSASPTTQQTAVMPSVAATAGAAGPIYRAPPPPPPPPASDKAAQSPNRSGVGRGLIAAVLVLALAIAGVAVAIVLSKKNPTTSTLADRHAPAANTSPATTPSPETVTETVQAPATTTAVGRTTVAAVVHTPKPSSNPPPTSASSVQGAQAALEQYWQDMGSGDYTDAYALQSPKQQSDLSESTMAADNAAVNVIWTKPAKPVPSNPDEATVEISFYAQNQSGSDQNCRHFILNELMVNSGGQWLYDGPSGTYLADIADGDPNCPA